MAHKDIFTHEDLRQIEAHGLTVETVFRQLELFKRPASYLNLVRPCTKGDGIKVLDPETMRIFQETYEREILKRRAVKFVPASGAASRMFKTLLGARHAEEDSLSESVEKNGRAAHEGRPELLEFIHGIRKFAFFQDLMAEMANQGINIDMSLKTGRFEEIIHCLLDEVGLNYASLPKGLLKFHEYAGESRTAFEEHLVEAVSYVADGQGQCHLQFTVSLEHVLNFNMLLEKIKSFYEEKHPVRFQVTFSVQKASTDTIAVNPDNTPFRDEKGRLLFRPGGHGALIENVNDLMADIVFIKNIDNVVPDRFKSETVKWKKILGGCLVSLQGRIHGYLEKLYIDDVDESILAEAMAFMKKELFLQVPDSVETAALEKKKSFVTEKLNRPIRICGMVKNVGEPGGGPFWVQDKDGSISLQVVESAQIDPNSKSQQNILAASTHFNPVDLVCGVGNWQGGSFDLRQYIDEHAVFISEKSKDGQNLKALEHPGLWNGAMAKWITVFVEVPIITFNPVKTVNDLLRREHQAE